MYIKSGFEFLVTKNNYIGHILYIDNDNDAAICMFFDDKGNLFKICTVYVQTIKNNLKDGTYKEIKRK